jgi:hypothetical protein
VLPWFETRKKELANRPLIREQALDAGKLERLGRFEVHLDRKLERLLNTLSILAIKGRRSPAAMTCKAAMTSASRPVF